MTSILFHNDTVTLNHLWFESHRRLLTSVCIELGQVDKIDELTEKYLGTKLKIKTLKDPNKPKRAKTAYLCFCNAKRPALIEKMKKKKEKINVGAIQKKLGKEWGKMTDEDKKQMGLVDEASEWTRYDDPATGHAYWCNNITGISTWEEPEHYQ